MADQDQSRTTLDDVRPERRPNLLLIMADQWRGAATGDDRTDPTHTPAVDSLVREGCHLPNAVSNYPMCAPARAMLMSGQYPHRNGVHLNVNSTTGAQGAGLRKEVPCWSDVLADHGYSLGYIGKWHLDAPQSADRHHGAGPKEDGVVWDAYTPPERRHGFRFWYSYGCADHHRNPHYWVGDAPRESPRHVTAWSPIHETDVAIDFLQRAANTYHTRGQPFGLVVSYNPPHQPFDAVPGRYRRDYAHLQTTDLLTRDNVAWGSAAAAEAQACATDYFSAITGVDEQIGRLLATLDGSGVTDDTVVVFTSDHGMQLGSHGLMYKNTWYEESLLVPLVVRWPGHVEPGRDDQCLGLVDLAPTILGLLGQREHIPAQMQGRDLSSAIGSSQPTPPGSALYFKYPSSPADPDVRGLRTRDRFLVIERAPDGISRPRLYDLERDPYQVRDEAAHRPVERESLQAELHDALNRIGDPWGPRRPHQLTRQAERA